MKYLEKTMKSKGRILKKSVQNYVNCPVFLELYYLIESKRQKMEKLAKIFSKITSKMNSKMTLLN